MSREMTGPFKSAADIVCKLADYFSTEPNCEHRSEHRGHCHDCVTHHLTALLDELLGPLAADRLHLNSYHLGGCSAYMDDGEPCSCGAREIYRRANALRDYARASARRE